MKSLISSTAAMLCCVVLIHMASCKKTRFTQGDAPELDTTNAALPPKPEKPVDPDPPVEPPAEETKPSKYLVMNGTTNYMTIAHHADLDIRLGESKTITFWIRTTTTSSSPRLITKRTTPGYEITTNSAGKFALNLRSLAPYNSNDGTTWATIDIRDDQWHHIAMVVDQNGAVKSSNLYIDGVLNQTSITSFADPHDFSAPSDLVVGAKSDGTFNNKYAGNIDDIRIYSKAMTFSEIQGDMANTSLGASTAGLIAAWDFETINGSTVTDVKGSMPGIVSGPVVTGERQVKK